MKAFASTLGAVGIGVAARDCSWPRADANTARRIKLSKGRNMNGNTLVKSALVYSLREQVACPSPLRDVHRVRRRAPAPPRCDRIPERREQDRCALGTFCGLR